PANLRSKSARRVDSMATRAAAVTLPPRPWGRLVNGRSIMRSGKILAAAVPLVLLLVAHLAPAAEPAAGESAATGPLRLVVMDPLAEPLSCPCVEGYAQRKYEKLAEYLSQELGREVTVAF